MLSRIFISFNNSPAVGEYGSSVRKPCLEDKESRDFKYVSQMGCFESNENLSSKKKLYKLQN